MITCKVSINDNYIYVECFNTEGEKSLRLDIYDLDSNLKLSDFKFNILNYTKVWNQLTYSPVNFNFVNGYKLILINTITNEIEFSDILLIKPYTKTKFIDDNNLLSHRMCEALNDNYLYTIKDFKDDILDIKNCDVIVDLGSTIGLFTAYALDQNPNIKSICVEMNSEFHKVCADTFKHNPNIFPINSAIYKKSNEKIIFKSLKEDLGDLGNTIVDNLFTDQIYSSTVDTISLDDIITNYNIDRISLLKVDIEGYEYELFENLSDDTLNKIDKIFLEFHRVVDPNRKLNLINRLMINGFKMKMFNDVNFYSTVMFSLFFSK